MTSLIKRNLKIFFRDKGAVFFSLLSVFIIIGIYILFLKDTLIQGYNSVKDIEALISTWIMSGIMAVVSVTTTLGAFGVMVHDREGSIINDFYSSPISKPAVAAGYIISAFIIGFIMSVITFLLAQIYLYITADLLLTLKEILKILGIILLSVLAGSSMMFFIITFIKTNNAYTTLSIVVGTLIGFFTGVYIPIGSLVEGVQNIVKVFPISHSGVLFKNILMSEPIQNSFGDAPGKIKEIFIENMGITYTWNDIELSLLHSICILLITAVIFYILGVINLSRKQNSL